MNLTHKTKSLKSVGINAKIIATLANVIVMYLNFSKTQKIRYIIHPTHKLVWMNYDLAQNCLNCCWEAKCRRNFSPETFLRGVVDMILNSGEAKYNLITPPQTSEPSLSWFAVNRLTSTKMATMLPFWARSQYWWSYRGLNCGIDFFACKHKHWIVSKSRQNVNYSAL